MTLINKTAKKDAQAKRTNKGSLLAIKKIEWQELRLENINSTANCERILKAMLNNEAALKNSSEKLVIGMGIYADKQNITTRVFDKLVKDKHGDLKKATRAYNKAMSYNKATSQTAARGCVRDI